MLTPLTMKYFFTSLLVLVIATKAYSISGTDSVTICGHQLAIPPELKLTKPQELTGETYSVSWQYISKRELEKMPDKVAASLNRTLKNESHENLLCYFLHEPSKAYGYTFDDSNGSRTGKIIIFANVNDQPVYVQITLSGTVFENEKLSLFINRLIVLGR